MLHNVFIKILIIKYLTCIPGDTSLNEIHSPLFTTFSLITVRQFCLFTSISSRRSRIPRQSTSLEELDFYVNSRHHKTNNSRINSPTNFSCDMRSEKIILCMNFLAYRVYLQLIPKFTKLRVYIF